jgi:hypothetical protein
VRWHFDPATGCPFWLEKAREFAFDPLKDITTDADLDRFGGFEDEWLRGGPVRRWVPKAYADIYFAPTYGNTLMGLATHNRRNPRTTTRSSITRRTRGR